MSEEKPFQNFDSETSKKIESEYRERNAKRLEDAKEAFLKLSPEEKINQIEKYRFYIREDYVYPDEKALAHYMIEWAEGREPEIEPKLTPNPEHN